MQKLSLHIDFTEYDSIDELDPADKALIEKASDALLQAYAPYSNFKVGAAILLDNGEIILGNNQENAAYPTGLCAERVALFFAGANYPATKIKTIAVSARSGKFMIKDVLTPCGGCRQAIAEYEVKQQSPIRIIMTSEKGKVLVAESIDALLPLKFYSHNFGTPSGK